MFYFLFFLLLISSAPLSVSFAATALAPFQCLDCHEDMLNADLAKKNVHPPYRQRKCVTCHINNQVQKSPLSDQQNGFSPEDQASQHIQWLVKGLQVASTHWFVVPKDSMATDLFIGGEDARNKIWLKKLPLPPWKELKELKNDLAPPLIKNVKVESIQRGIFISALIRWSTDEYANSRIAYGNKALDSYSAPDDQYVTEHQMLLMGLKANLQYQFAVISSDIFGNKAVSATFTLSTAEAKTASMVSPESSNVFNSGQTYSSELFRHENSFLIKIVAEKPGVLSLGTNIHPLAAKLASRRDAMVEMLGEEHASLKNKRDTDIQLCYTCHMEYTKALSHPIGVLPKKGMVIPAGYPVLPDGRVSCVSCHERHASNNKNRMIKPTNREVCIGCHKEMA